MSAHSQRVGFQFLDQRDLALIVRLTFLVNHQDVRELC
jgi:hypothetical protein